MRSSGVAGHGLTENRAGTLLWKVIGNLNWKSRSKGNDEKDVATWPSPFEAQVCLGPAL